MKPVNFDMNTILQYGLVKSFDDYVAKVKSEEDFNQIMDCVENLSDEALGSLLVHVEVILNKRKNKVA